MKEKQLSDVTLRPYRVFFRAKTLRKMSATGISGGDVHVVVRSGKVIEERENDEPCPIYLLKARIRGRPIHAVVPYDKDEDRVFVSAVYEPDAKTWDATFSRREA